MTKHDIVKQIFQAMNSRDFGLLDPFMEDDVVFEFPGVDPAKGKKKVLLLMNVILRKYSELAFDLKDILVDKEKAIAVWTNHGISKAGKPYSNSGITLVEFRENKIVFLSDYFKDTSFTNPK